MLARRLFSLFLCLSLSLYSKFVDITINLSLILKTTRIQKQFPLSVFVFIDSLVVSASQDADGYAISRQNKIELHLGCHTCWVSYFTLVCLWCGLTAGGQADGRTITWLPKFLGWVDYHILLGMGLRSRARGAPLWKYVSDDISLKSGNVWDDVIASHVTVKNFVRAVRFFPREVDYKSRMSRNKDSKTSLSQWKLLLSTPVTHFLWLITKMRSVLKWVSTNCFLVVLTMYRDHWDTRKCHQVC